MQPLAHAGHMVSTQQMQILVGVENLVKGAIELK